MSPTSLFSEGNIGATQVKNRVFMAPLTRNRAQADGTPKAMATEYYKQRATAGLIITEATQISPLGKGYLDTPGLYNETHAEAWKAITSAVHQQNGKIFIQLWHVGRISHLSLLPKGEQPIAPSAIRANSQTFTEKGFEDTSDPRAIKSEEIPSLIEQYRSATRLAKSAGFDGVEVHGANGYLLIQFIASNCNKRTDAYGGTIENRSRLLLEVIDAVSNEIGAEKVGVRLSPIGQFNDIDVSDSSEIYPYIYKELENRKLAYLHVVEAFPGADVPEAHKTLIENLRSSFKGNYIANGGYDKDRGQDIVNSGLAFAVAYGRPYISNPDLPARFDKGIALTEPDQSTFYGGNETGYTDYPAAT